VRDPTKKSNTPLVVGQLRPEIEGVNRSPQAGAGAGAAPGEAGPSEANDRAGGGIAGDRIEGGYGVYVHFPWCLAKCPYCDFVSYAQGDRAAIDHAGYADAVIRELDARAAAAAWTGRGKLHSVFFGGGTPSLWEPRELGRVLARIGARLDPSADLEVTVECNPSSIDEDRARALHDAGVNRLSIGVQSLSDDRLRFLGRLHDAKGALEAVRGALRSGVPRVSADLIFGQPGQSSRDACDEAGALVDLGLDHLSCYQLTIEPGTRFGELSKRGRLPLADDGAVADAFLALDDALRARGFEHYEISNYARPGQGARHNLGYWRGHEYLGLGCAAYGFLRQDAPGSDDGGPPAARGVRYRNEVLPERYARGAPASEEALDAPTLLRERIMLGLRTAEGVDIDAAARSLGLRDAGWTPSRERAAAWLAERGRVVRERGVARIPRAAWLWADDTAARLF
jgi:oxygen-independent coproporphyrinogen-3 oxidase